MGILDKIISQVNGVVWSPALVALLVCAGLYFSVRTGFVQVRRFGLMLKALFAPAERHDDMELHLQKIYEI